MFISCKTKNVQAETTLIEPPHDKNNKMAYAPSEDSDQPGHPPSLISRCPPEESVDP